MSSPPVPSRRQFLSRTASVAGASALLGAPGLARARQDPPADAKTLRMGLIGTGGMGGGHLEAFMGFQADGKEQVHVVALCDVCKPRLDKWVARCSEKQGFAVDEYRDYRQLLAREDIDCVLIASPEHWHAQMAIDALDAGKDVYLEKPMTLRLEDALRLYHAVNASDRRLQVGTQYMMVPKYEAAKKLIAEGAIGKPTLSQTSYCRNSRDGEWLYGIDPKVKPGEMLDWEAWCGPLGPAKFDTEVYHRWRRYKRYSTGIVGDLLVHMMTPLIYALDLGWPVRVTGTGGHYVDKKMSNHDNVFLTVEFEREHTMVVAGSTCNSTGVETMIRGHKANLLLGGNDCVLRPERPYVDDVDEQKIECEGLRDQDELRLNWLSCVRSREQVRSTVELGLKHMIIVDLATRSMWEGGAFRFHPRTLEATPI